MSANATPQTAIEITTLPYTVTIDPVGNADSLFLPDCEVDAIKVPLWWKYTPPATVTAIGINWNSTDDGQNYNPLLTVWTGTPPTLTQIPEVCFDWGGDDTKPGFTQINVTPGTAYYIQVTHDPGLVFGGASCVFGVLPPTDKVIQNSSLFVTNDTTGFPAAILSPINGEVLKILGFPACEGADVFPSGIMAVAAERQSDDDVVSINVYDSSLVLIASNTTLPIANQSAMSPIRIDHTDKFYIACPDAALVSATIIKTMDMIGNTLIPSWTLPVNSINIQAMDISRDKTILYYGGKIDSAIHKYDLINSIALADLVADAGGDTEIGRDIYVTLAGDILVVYRANFTSSGFEVRRYNSSGVLQTTYSLGTSVGSSPRIALLDNNTEFWCMSFPVSGTSRFQKFNILTGAVALTFDVIQKNASDSAINAFGPSQSCPLLILPIVISPLSGIYKLVPDKINDTIYLTPVSTEDRDIPNPFIETGMIGDE